MKEIKSKHRFVANQIALGLDLGKICQAYGLNIDTWRRIAGEPMFKQAVQEIQEKLEDRLIEEHVSNPTLALLQAEQYETVKALISLRDADPSMVNSGTILGACNSLLDRGGTLKGEAEQRHTVIIEKLSSEQLAHLRTKTRPTTVKDNVLGVKDLD